MHAPIVIIGGMGPQASLRFHELLLTKSRLHQSGDGHEFPFIVHFSIPIVDFISDVSQEAAAIQTLGTLLSVVKRLHPYRIALACNTAHRLISRAPLLQLPMFLSMLETVANRLAADNVHTLGILASPTTIQTNLYETVLETRGITTITPSFDELMYIEATIRRVIAGKITHEDQLQLAALAQTLIDRGATAVLLGCTELPLVFDKRVCRFPVYDCLDIYAENTVQDYYS